MKFPKISIITAVFNGGKFLEQSIQSILNQTYSQIEYIIIDGKSYDNSIDIIKKYESKISFWISESDKGVYDAWNKGITKANGDWIWFIGSDDFIPDKRIIEKAVPYLIRAKEKGIKLVYGNINYIHSSTLKVISRLGMPWSKTKKRITKIMCLPHGGTFHHRSLFQEYGKFNTDFKIAGDYEFILRELKNPAKKALYMEELNVLNMRNEGLTGDLKSRIGTIEEAQKAREVNGFRFMSADIFFWLLRMKIFLIGQRLLGNATSNLLADWYRKLKYS